MPESPAVSESIWQRIVRWVVGATEGFLADDVPRMAAAMSYFLLLALAPLILLANMLFQALGLVTGRTPQAPNVAAAGQTAAQSFADMTAWAGTYAPWVIGVLVIVGALSVFGQFVDGVNKIWKIPPRRTPVKDYLRQRGLALALLGVAALGFIAALIVTAIIGIVIAIGLAYAQNLGVPIPDWGVNAWFRALVVLVASAVLFIVGFVVAPDRRVRWLDAVPGALLTAVAFLIGEQVLALYLGSTERFAVFGASQFFVGLTVWIYYSALVVFAGVELTRMMVLDAEARRGEAPPPAIDLAAAAAGAGVPTDPHKAD